MWMFLSSLFLISLWVNVFVKRQLEFFTFAGMAKRKGDRQPETVEIRLQCDFAVYGFAPETFLSLRQQNTLLASKRKKQQEANKFFMFSVYFVPGLFVSMSKAKQKVNHIKRKKNFPVNLWVDFGWFGWANRHNCKRLKGRRNNYRRKYFYISYLPIEHDETI